MKRTAFFISDSTGITAETLGRSLLTQFDQVEFNTITIPFVDTIQKAEQTLQKIKKTYEEDKLKPLIFSTLVNPEIYSILSNSDGLFLDFFKAFLDPLELELQAHSSHRIGRSHALDNSAYVKRIEAMNFALNNDDGVNLHNFGEADVILIGVSRSAKTPTCLYLALQFSVFAANYPFTEDDMNDQLELPKFLQPYRQKLFGLTIDPLRLHKIRSERKPDSRYASLAQCEKEVRLLERLFVKEKIDYLSTTTRSIEEISATIISVKGLQRH